MDDKVIPPMSSGQVPVRPHDQSTTAAPRLRSLLALRLEHILGSEPALDHTFRFGHGTSGLQKKKDEQPIDDPDDKDIRQSLDNLTFGYGFEDDDDSDGDDFYEERGPNHSRRLPVQFSSDSEVYNRSRVRKRARAQARSRHRNTSLSREPSRRIPRATEGGARGTPPERDEMQSQGTFGRGPQPGTPPAQTAQHSQANGIGGHTAAGAPNASGMPNGVLHPGQQIDLNYLWSLVEELSEQLSQNRAQTAAIIGNVQRMQTRPALEDTQTDSNGDAPPANHAAEIAALRSDIHEQNKTIDRLSADAKDLSDLVHDYETALANLMPKIRQYAHDHNAALIALHKHYNALLETERDANLQLRLEHGDWQAGLGRAMEWARKALRAQSEQDAQATAREAELKYENRVLRRLVGWEVEPDSDDEREREAEEELRRKAGEAEAGRAEGAAGNAA